MSGDQPHFNGPDYVPERDDARLSRQNARVRQFMFDGKWHTLQEIANSTGDPAASVSAQLRHLRKPRFGGYIIEKYYVGDGLFQYRLLIPENTENLDK